MTKEEWTAAAESLLKRIYGLELNDCDAPPDWWDTVSPAEFVDWVGLKYGLEDIRPQVEITYEATFADGESEHFALEVATEDLTDFPRLRELCERDLESRWMPEYSDWPDGAVTRMEVELPGGQWVDV